MSDLTFSQSIDIAASPEAVYDLVSDVTRTGEWSPICRECWWEEGASARVGDWFHGRNVTPDRTWETRSEVVAAERGREFAWIVGGTYVRWGYRLAPTDAGGTTLTESWEFLPGGLTMFDERYGDEAPAQIKNRVDAAHDGIPRTLAAIKRIAEGG
ncbi:MAG TPA: SRPBCC family protein [Jatrophihabitans sp.]|jgi:hypothetical protein|uniref:SRPBCC family protein n=1 Tax=Jatrophihabitans sp. TaxID=1932789 RepID=UPI002DFF4E1F|nr:SRPBCC family protein [Jatrophihabitans sp.]